jgi:uncharacterized protein
VHEFVFVVKVSKFCNLRCSYCYEHRELHVRDRLRMSTLQRLFADVDGFGRYLARLGYAPEFSFVWHGGEPLLLEADFYRKIAALQQDCIREHAWTNSVQTNLFRVDKASLKFVLDSQWKLGVSIDFADGVRSNIGGRDSNASVIAAAEALHQSGGKFGAISVLGAHNAKLLPDAYDWVAEFAQGWRILPVFAGGPEESTARLQLPEQDVARVLQEVFLRRAHAKKHIPIAPIDGYIKWATHRIAGHRTPGPVDRDVLDNIFVINVNGDVFTRPFAYEPGHCLGNVNTSSIVEMVEGQAYRACQNAITRRKIRNCAECEYSGYCDSSPMHEHGSVTSAGGRCAFAQRTTRGIEEELIASGVDAAAIAQWARESFALHPR